MEKFKTYERETDNGSFSLIAHRFTETEQKELEAALCRYDPKAVNEFIYDLQLLCDAMIYLLRHSDRGSLRKDREWMLRRFKNAIEDVLRMHEEEYGKFRLGTEKYLENSFDIELNIGTNLQILSS